MNALNKILVAALVAGGISAPAFAQSQASANATSTVSIIQPITLTNTGNLRFGTIVRPASSSATVTVAASNGAITVGSGASRITSSTTGRATYDVGGEANQAFSINADATVDMTGSGAAITVTLTESAASGTLNGSGAASFGVGGSFSVASTQASGAYTGTFSTTVDYN